VLGTKYNGDPDLDKIPLYDIPSANKGWGDCDDVSEIVAAGVLALGMTPFFRVVMSDRGGHVSVVARTPRGELVSLDPVGLPEHGFGWMLPATPSQVSYFDMQGSRAPSLGACECKSPNKTALIRAGRTFKPFAQTNTHYVRSYPGMMPPSILAVKSGGYLSAIDCRDGLAAVDEHGQGWYYDAMGDIWEPMLSGFFDNVKRRWKKRIKAVRNVVKKVRELHNTIVAKILSNKVGQRLVGTALMVWGVPPRVAPAVMTAAAEIIKKGGLIGLLRMLRKSRKAAMWLVAAAVKKGLIATGLVPPAAQKFLSGADDNGSSLVADQNGEATPVWPIAAIIEVPLGADDWSRAKKKPDTAAETKNVKMALASRPATSRGYLPKAGQADSDWLTNVVLWETYPDSPYEIDSKNKSHKVYQTAWIRINKQIKNNLAVKKTGGDDAFAMNKSESAIAKQVAVEKPTSWEGRTQKAGQSLQDWLSNVAYWQAYPSGPEDLDSKNSSHKNYINAWRRIAAIVKKNVGATSKTTPKTTPTKKTTPKTTPTKKTTPKTTPTKKTTPKTTTPTQQTTPQSSTNCWEDERGQQSICQDVQVNPEEKAIAIEVAKERPTSETVHGTTIHQGTKSDLPWLTNVAYWRAYPEGPVEIPASAPQYEQAWSRLQAAVKVALKTKPTKTTPKTPKTELPDLDPQEMACLRQGGKWDAAARMCREQGVGPIDPPIEPKKEGLNWLPIAAAVGAALLLKG
jgi:hypothetical protein